MRSIFTAIFCSIAFFSLSQKRLAQFSIAAEAGVMATGQAFKVYNLGFGGSAKVLVPAGKKNFYTGTLELMAFSGRSGNPSEIFGTSLPASGINIAHPSLTLIVPKAGYKYFLNKTFSAEVEAGYTFAIVKKLYESIPGNVGGYTFSGGFGFLVSKKLDIGMRYELFESTASETNYTSFVALRTLLILDFKNK